MNNRLMVNSSGHIESCALVVEPDIHYRSIETPNLVWFPAGRPAVTLSPYFLHLRALREAVAMKGVQYEHIVKGDQLIVEEFARLDSLGLGQAARQLYLSRLKVALLIDTAGGVARYKGSLDRVRELNLRSGGEWRAYGGVNVMSLGALLLMEAKREERIVHPFSRLFFHVGRWDPGVDISDSERRSNRFQDQIELRDLLMEKTAEEMRPQMMCLLKDNLLSENPKHPDRRVEMLGHQASQYGLAQSMSAAAMRNHFRSTHGIEEWQMANTPVAHFFDRIDRMESETRRKLEMAIGLFGKE